MNNKPSPLLRDTHLDEGLAAAIPFEPLAALPPRGAPASDATAALADLSTTTRRILGVPEEAAVDLFDVGAQSGLPAWMVSGTRMIRPLCVGALMAVPTLGAATVGTVAIFSHAAAMHSVQASTAFLAGIPTEIVLLIGALTTGYSLSKTVERIRGVRR